MTGFESDAVLAARELAAAIENLGGAIFGGLLLIALVNVIRS